MKFFETIVGLAVLVLVAGYGLFHWHSRCESEMALRERREMRDRAWKASDQDPWGMM